MMKPVTMSGHLHHDNRGQDASQHFGDHIDGPLIPGWALAKQCPYDHGARGAGGVERSTRGWCDCHDDGEDGEPDRQSRETVRCPAMNHAEDGGDQHKRAEKLGGKGLL